MIYVTYDGYIIKYADKAAQARINSIITKSPREEYELFDDVLKRLVFAWRNIF